jgi:hypothetical protein
MQYVIEAIILFIHAPPGLYFTVPDSALTPGSERHRWHAISFDSDTVICSLMFIRVYHIWKVAREFFGLTNESARSITVWYEEGENLNVNTFDQFALMDYFLKFVLIKLAEMSNTFIARAILVRHPLSTVTVLILLVVTCSSYLLLLFERKVDPMFESIGTSIWLVVSTVSTVGYGDVYPHTSAGRVLIGMLCVITIFLISLLISGVIRFVNEFVTHML